MSKFLLQTSCSQQIYPTNFFLCWYIHNITFKAGNSEATQENITTNSRKGSIYSTINQREEDIVNLSTISTSTPNQITLFNPINGLVGKCNSTIKISWKSKEINIVPKTLGNVIRHITHEALNLIAPKKTDKVFSTWISYEG